MGRTIAGLVSAVLLAGALQGCAGQALSIRQVSTVLQKNDNGWLHLSDYERGKHYLAVGDYGLAVDAFNAALAKDKKSIQAMNGLAIAYGRIGRTDVAARYLGAALEADPQSPYTLNNMAYLYLSEGDKTKALSYAERATAALSSAKKAVVSGPLGNVISANIALASPPANVHAANTDKPKPPPALRRIGERNWELRVTQSADRDDRASDVRAGQPAALDNTTGRSGKVLATDVAETNVDVRVSNGTGRHNMAHRFGDYLASHGVAVRHLVNARTFNRKRSVIFYSRGCRGAAQKIAGVLPQAVRLVGLSNDFGAVELMLGADLDKFDARLAAS